MALSMRNFSLQKHLNVLFNKNKPISILSLQSSSRQLRGSRYGRGHGLDKTEAKFRELLKNLEQPKRHPKESTLHEIPETVVKSFNIKELPEPLVTISDIVDDDLSERLKGKITPLRKLTYTHQLERKYSKSMSLLRMFGERLMLFKVPITMGKDKLPCPVELMLPSPLTEGYRNQDEFSVGVGIDGNPKTIGFYLNNLTEDSNFICADPSELIIIKDCHKMFIKDFQAYIRDSCLPPFSPTSSTGHWKSVSVRSSMTGDLMGIVVMHPQDLSDEEINLEKKRLCEYFETYKKSYNLKSLYLQARKGTEEEPFHLLFGDPYIVEELNGLKFQISPSCFFLPNSSASTSLYNVIRKLCRVGKSTTVLDVFCGIGPISLSFAPYVKKCIGVDLSPETTDLAESNAVINNIHNTEFIHGDVETSLADIISQGYHTDIIAIISPSRTDLTKAAVRALRECKYLKKIIYITTKPKAAVDNFVKLCRPCGKELHLGKPFVPLLAIPVDLNPQTDHYGLAVMFQRL